MADTLDSTGKYVPKDLQITAQPDSVDKDKFKIVIANLKIDKPLVFQFQYVFPDGELSEWSPGYTLNTSTESVPGAPTAAVPSTGTGSIPVTLSSFPANAKRVDVYVINGIFGTGKIAYSFFSAGTTTIAAPAGTYQVQLITVTPSGINGTPTQTFTITIADVGETIQAPTNPNGFSITRILGGIELSWAGTYANGTFTGFEAIKVYVGNSATATTGTYKEGGVMTGNNVKNTIVIPVDGTYLRYSQPVYIHAAAVNKNGTVGTMQQNVASDPLGARSAIADDLDNQIITNAKLVDSAVTEAKIATSAITETKIATDAVTSSKIIANAITADKITSSAITSDKIAANAITAGKILAGEIDVSKLRAGTLSVNNLEAGNINSTSFIRAGTANSARVEISSAAVGTVNPGLYIYNSAGTAVLSAPLNGGLTINGGGTFSGDISGASGTFSGNLSSSNGQFSVISGSITALSGSIGNWVINSGKLASSSGSSPSIELDPSTPQIVIRGTGSYNGYNITLAAPSGISAGSTFSVTPAGYLQSTSGQIGGWTIGPTQLTGGGLTLSSSGSITNTGTIPGFFTTYVPSTATLSSGYLNIFLSENTIATIGSYSGLGSDGGAYIQNYTNKLTLSPVSLYLQATSTQNGVIPGGFYITHASGDYNIHFGFTGYDGTQYVRRIVWDLWGIASQRDSDNFSNIYDANGQSLRPLVIDSDGSMGLGYTQYFSTTQTTTPSSGTGRNGDIYFSTA